MDQPSAEHRVRVRVFVDFWNFQAEMRGTEEKGVDTHIATAMISLAWIDNYDVAVLVSSDRDFIRSWSSSKRGASRSCMERFRLRHPI